MGRKNKRAQRSRRRSLKIDVRARTGLCSGMSLEAETVVLSRMEARKKLKSGVPIKLLFDEFLAIKLEAESVWSRREAKQIMARARGIGQAILEHLSSKG